MTVETKFDLSADTIATLQELIRINIDSHDNLIYASQKIEDMNIASLFERVANERDIQAKDLSKYVALNAEDPKSEGSYYASFQRTMLSIREALTSNNNYTVLAEAEKCEDVIKHAYEGALKDIPGSAMNAILTQQYSQVKQAHDHIRDLRDTYKND